MNLKLKLAKQYLDYCLNSKFQELECILSKDLSFSGPFLNSISREEYLMNLKESPFINEHYLIKYEFFDDKYVCLVYELVKKEINLLVSQIFEFEEEKIKKIVTVFDSKEI